MADTPATDVVNNSNDSDLSTRQADWRRRRKDEYSTYVKIGLVVNLLMLAPTVWRITPFLPEALQPYTWAWHSTLAVICSFTLPMLIVAVEAGPMPRK